MQHYLVTGATGFIGGALCAELAAAGARLSALSRDPERARALLPAGTRIVARLEQLGDAPVDAVINLAGAPIADRRWSAARKHVLEQSRIALTRELVDWMQQRSPRPAVLVSASAIGFYGDQGDALVTEQTGMGPGLGSGLICFPSGVPPPGKQIRPDPNPGPIPVCSVTSASPWSP